MSASNETTIKGPSHRLPLMAALAVVVLALVVTLGTQFTGEGKVTRTIGEVDRERLLQFRDGEAGTVIVSDISRGLFVLTPRFPDPPLFEDGFEDTP